MLGYCGFLQLNTWFFQHRERQHLYRLMHEERPIENGLLQTRSAVSTKSPRSVAPNGLIGRMEILRLGVSVIIMEGTDTSTLRSAAGHIEGTALPGQPGNVGIAGHRDTFFRPLRSIQRNELVTLTTLDGEYRYRVVSTKIVSPKDIAVLASNENEVLTLVTCYPFYFVGAAPGRFIVRAERVP